MSLPTSSTDITRAPAITKDSTEPINIPNSPQDERPKSNVHKKLEAFLREQKADMAKRNAEEGEVSNPLTADPKDTNPKKQPYTGVIPGGPIIYAGKGDSAADRDNKSEEIRREEERAKDKRSAGN